MSSTTSLSSLNLSRTGSPYSSMSRASFVNSSDLNFAQQNDSSRISKLKSRFIRTLLAFGFYIGNLMLNATLVTIINERVPTQVLPLPDVSFDLLPYWPDGIFIVEFYLFFLNLLLILLIIFHRNGDRIAQRYCVIAGVVFFFKAICIGVTQLPEPGNRFNCEPKMNTTVSNLAFVQTMLKRCMIYIPSLGFHTLMPRELIYCGDYLYSGHAINIIIVYSFLSAYLMPTEVKVTSLWWWLADVLLYSLSIVAVFLLLIARRHYLVDIIFAYLVSTRTFYIYHTICGHESLHYASFGNFFPKFWWWPLFVFFEVDNPGRIVAVNRFYNPFNVIKSLLTKKKSNNATLKSNFSLNQQPSSKRVTFQQ